jgi:hypothetical protein
MASVVGHGELVSSFPNPEPVVPPGKRVVFLSKAGYTLNKRAVTDDPKMQSFLKSPTKMNKLIAGTLTELPKYMEHWSWKQHTAGPGQTFKDMQIFTSDPIYENQQLSPSQEQMFLTYDSMCGVWINGHRTRYDQDLRVSEILKFMPPGTLFVCACRSTHRASIVRNKIHPPSSESIRRFLQPPYKQNYPTYLGDEAIIEAIAYNREGAKKLHLKKHSPPRNIVPERKKMRTVVPRTIRRTVVPRTIRKSVVPRSIRKTVTPKSIRKSVVPRRIKKSVVPRTSPKLLGKSVRRGPFKIGPKFQWRLLVPKVSPMQIN